MDLGDKANKASKHGLHRAEAKLRGQAKAVSGRGKKLAAASLAVGAGSAVLHRKKNSDSWKPHVSKALGASAFGVVHD